MNDDWPCLLSVPPFHVTSGITAGSLSVSTLGYDEPEIVYVSSFWSDLILLKDVRNRHFRIPQLAEFGSELVNEKRVAG
jgi:hypothetical protein